MKDDISHVLDLPDMYVGSTRLYKVKEFCGLQKEDNFVIERQEVVYPPALIRIFIEILSNAIDNVQRSREFGPECKSIKISINKDTGETSVWNDGMVIPIELSNIEIEGKKLYNHSLIFGYMRTSGNYDKDEKKTVSGKNGVGSSCTNCFSSQFTVKGLDPINHKSLEQTWTENSRKTTGPKVVSSKLKTGYTQVIYTPDFKRFGISEYSDDIISILLKYVIDTAMLTKVKVYFNDTLVKVSTLQSYAKFYSEVDLARKDMLHIQIPNNEVLVCPSNGTGFQSISFVNGIYTREGGVHVNAFVETLFRPIVEKLNEKAKSKLTIADVKAYFRLFVVSTVINPEFSSQEKVRLDYPKVDAKVDTAITDKLLKWSVIKDILDYIKLKNNLSLKNVEKKSKNFIRIEKLDDANDAGGPKGYQCSLILCEGDSAKTFGITGMQTGIYGTKGRDKLGIMSLFGKVLNVRNSTPETIAKNKVVVNIINAIGLKQDVDYSLDENWKKLRYGRVIILTDADCDGLAIASLILNLFHVLFPTTLKRPSPFVVNMCTPIVRISGIKGGDLLFYDESRFREFAKTKTPDWLKKHSQYYKGLGSSTDKDAKELFGKKMIEYEFDSKADDTLNKVFHKKNADMRKDWLERYDPSKPKALSIDDQGQFTTMAITDFLENETITFSWADCKRSIPNLIDGFKESQRKVLFGAKKANLAYNKPPMKVAQFGAYVSKETCYHHGEQSLYETIVKMAQKFVGSNNIPLLDRKGNFGTRLVNGDDSAQPRYIFTKMDALTHLIFRKDDDPLLDYVNDDGDDVEPAFYVPIIPMILVNGALGIGTGWSSSIPMYNPLDLIECIKLWLDNEGEITHKDPETDIEISLFPSLSPWYNGFEGSIVKEGNKFVSYGVQKQVNSSSVQITELPIGMSIDKFKVSMEELVENKALHKMVNNSTPNQADFTLSYKEKLPNLGLHSYLHITNMVLFNGSERLKKYSIDEILDEFCKCRFRYYKLRKQYLIKKLESEISHLENKIKFVSECIEGTIDLRNIDESKAISILESKHYNKEDNGYDYLLNMPMKSQTKTIIEKMKAELSLKLGELEKLKNQTEKSIWISELDEFEVEYKKYISEETIVKNKKNKKMLT